MGEIRDEASKVYRPYVTDGVPASGPNRPSKEEIANLFGLIETFLGAVAAGLKFFDTKAQLDAFSGPKDFLAYVRTGSGAGVYSWSGTAWVVDTAYAAGVATLVQPLVDAASDFADAAGLSAVDAQEAADSIPVVSDAAPGFAFSLLDDFGNVGAGLRIDGSWVLRKLVALAIQVQSISLGDAELSASAPYHFLFALLGEDGGAAFGIRDDATMVARHIEATTLNGVDVDAIIAGGGGGGGTARAITARNYDAEINYFPSYGQSLSMGGQSIPILSGGQRFDSIRFAGGTRTTEDNPNPYGSFVPLTELVGGPLSNLGETPLTGAFDMANELIFSEDRLTKANVAYQLLGSCPGQDGGSLEQQSKPSTAFNHLKADIANGYRLAQAAGKSFKFRGYGYAQGEGEGGSIGSTTPLFKAGLIKLRQDIEAEAKAVNSQAERVVALHYQTRFKPHIAQAHYEAARDDPDIYIATPIYMLPLVADGIHLTAFGSKIFGAYLGIAYKRVVIDGAVNWQSLVPINCDAQGRVATLRFNVPVGKLTIDTTLVPARGNYGFTLVDASDAAIVITAVTITSGDTIKLLTANPIPAGARVRYGWDTINPGGNIRDQQGDEIVFDGGGLNYPMHNYLVQFEETLS